MSQIQENTGHFLDFSQIQEIQDAWEPCKRVGKVQCFIFYSTSNLPISFKFLQIFTYYERKICVSFIKIGSLENLLQ